MRRKSRETGSDLMLFSMQPSGQNISFADGLHGQNHGLRRLIEYSVGVTTYLAGYSECE